MTALSAARNTPIRDGVQFSFPVAAATKIYQGSFVVLDSSGNAEPASTATGKIAVGRAEATVDNSAGLAAAVNVEVRAGTFKWANGSSLTKSSIGDTVYLDDDQTVNGTSTGRSPAGILVGVDSDGVWVYTSPDAILASTGLLAANNLSDVGTVATARANLGLDTGDNVEFTNVLASGTLSSTGNFAINTNKFTVAAASGNTVIAGTLGVTGAVSLTVDLAVADGGTGASTASAARTNLGLANKHVVSIEIPAGKLAGASAYRALAVAPIAGTISKIYSVLKGAALATGNATLTSKIAGTGITDGVITITQAGSAIGDIDSATPSALNTVTAGQLIEVLVGGTNDDTDAHAWVGFEITEG